MRDCNRQESVYQSESKWSGRFNFLGGKRQNDSPACTILTSRNWDGSRTLHYLLASLPGWDGRKGLFLRIHSLFRSHLACLLFACFLFSKQVCIHALLLLFLLDNGILLFCSLGRPMGNSNDTCLFVSVAQFHGKKWSSAFFFPFFPIRTMPCAMHIWSSSPWIVNKQILLFIFHNTSYQTSKSTVPPSYPQAFCSTTHTLVFASI